MKRLQSIIMMLFGAYCLSYAQSTFEENGILYMEDLSNPSKLAVVVIPKKPPMELVNTLYKGSLVIPAYVEHDLDTYEVTGIASLAFRGDYLEELTIEEGPTMVGDYAFNNTALRRVVYPGTLKRLPGLYSPALEELELGDGIVELREVFDGGKLKKMTFPKSLEIINTCQLNSIEGNLTLGPNIKEINHSFQEPHLSELTISGNSAKIDWSFYDCEALKNVDLAGVKTIKSSFRKCPSLEKIALGDIELIDDSFNGLVNIKELHIPRFCKEVTNSFSAKTDWSFDDCEDLAAIKKKKSSFCPSLEKVALGDIELIDGSFNGLANIKELHIPRSCKEVTNSFRDITSLEVLKIDEGVESIERSFAGAENLKILYIPLSLSLNLWRNKLEEVHFTSSTPTEKCPEYILRSQTDKLKVFVPKKSADNYRKAWGNDINPEKVVFVEE